MSSPALLPNRILIAVDSSEESLASSRYAIELAGKIGAEITALHVVMIPEYVSPEVAERLKKELIAKGESAIAAVRLEAQSKGVTLKEKTIVTGKSVVTAICEAALEENSGLVVMGTKGAGGVAKLMLGSIASGVSKEAHCPVLVVR